MFLSVICGNALHIPLPAGSVQCVVTSPPYWGLRDYGVGGQLGLEPTPEEYIVSMVAVFREVWRVLRDDGTLWLNLGDSYARESGNGSNGGGGKRGVFPEYDSARRIMSESRGSSDGLVGRADRAARRNNSDCLKPKDMVGIPWRVAFALQADGWWLRSDIIWHKPNPMPESVTDRPTSAHEYLFLLSKSKRYYYDADAIKEPCSESTHNRISQDLINQIGTTRANGGKKSNGNLKAVVSGSTALLKAGVNPKAMMNRDGRCKQNSSFSNATCLPVLQRNRRDVWTIATVSYSEAHFATFPPKLVEPCILAGSGPGDTVLDPFAGTGTVGEVAAKHGRDFVGVELSMDYIGLAQKRLRVLPVMLPGL
jgi:DNA modification methylase